VNKISRRSFVGRMAAGAAALAAASSTAEAQLVYRLSEWNVKDFDRLIDAPVQVKQVFEATSIEDGLVLDLIKNSLNGLEFGFGIPEKEIQVIGALHGPANLLNYDDSVWKKYALGEVFDVTDPATGKPAVRNPYYSSAAGKDLHYASNDPDADDSRYQDTSLEGLGARGVRFLSCHTALEGQARSVVERRKLTVDPEEVVKDMMAHAEPGVLIVPSMVASLALLQNRGHYAYMKV
jgi:intracellular sulfur oxidation DsrE/DsrF family protein